MRTAFELPVEQPPAVLVIFSQIENENALKNWRFHGQPDRLLEAT